MEVDFAFVCDYAEVGTKINALGIGFDMIIAPKVPIRHPHFHVVAQFRFSITESGYKDTEIHIIDADGLAIIPPIIRKMEVPKPMPGQLESIARMNAGFNNVEFKRYGSYSIRINLAGREVINIPLRIAEPSKTN